VRFEVCWKRERDGDIQRERKREREREREMMIAFIITLGEIM